MAIEDKNRASRQNNFTTMSAIKSYADDMLVNKKYEGDISHYVSYENGGKYHKIIKFSSGISYKLEISYISKYNNEIIEQSAGEINIESDLSGSTHNLILLSNNELIRERFRATIDSQNDIYLEQSLSAGQTNVKYKISCISALEFGGQKPYETLNPVIVSDAVENIYDISNPQNIEKSYPEDILILDSVGNDDCLYSDDVKILNSKNLLISQTQSINEAFGLANTFNDVINLYAYNDSLSYNVYIENSIPAGTLKLNWSNLSGESLANAIINEPLEKGDLIILYAEENNNQAKYIINKGAVKDYEYSSNKISTWSPIPDNNKYPTEKLVKDEIDNLSQNIENIEDSIGKGVLTINVEGRNSVSFSANSKIDREINIPVVDTEWIDRRLDNLENNMGSGTITDVNVNGTSVVSNGVANIIIPSEQDLSAYQTKVDQNIEVDGQTTIVGAINSLNKKVGGIPEPTEYYLKGPIALDELLLINDAIDGTAYEVYSGRNDDDTFSWEKYSYDGELRDPGTIIIRSNGQWIVPTNPPDFTGVMKLEKRPENISIIKSLYPSGSYDDLYGNNKAGIRIAKVENYKLNDDGVYESLFKDKGTPGQPYYSKSSESILSVPYARHYLQGGEQHYEGGVLDAADYQRLIEGNADIDTSLPQNPSNTHVPSTLLFTSQLATKQNILTFDNSPTENSNNPVKSGGIYTVLTGKSDTGHTHTVGDITDFPSFSDYVTKSTDQTIASNKTFKTSVFGQMSLRADGAFRNTPCLNFQSIRENQQTVEWIGAMGVKRTNQYTGYPVFYETQSTSSTEGINYKIVREGDSGSSTTPVFIDSNGKTQNCDLPSLFLKKDASNGTETTTETLLDYLIYNDFVDTTDSIYNYRVITASENGTYFRRKFSDIIKRIKPYKKIKMLNGSYSNGTVPIIVDELLKATKKLVIELECERSEGCYFPSFITFYDPDGWLDTQDAVGLEISIVTKPGYNEIVNNSFSTFGCIYYGESGSGGADDPATQTLKIYAISSHSDIITTPSPKWTITFSAPKTAKDLIFFTYLNNNNSWQTSRYANFSELPQIGFQTYLQMLEHNEL